MSSISSSAADDTTSLPSLAPGSEFISGYDSSSSDSDESSTTLSRNAAGDDGCDSASLSTSMSEPKNVSSSL